MPSLATAEIHPFLLPFIFRTPLFPTLNSSSLTHSLTPSLPCFSELNYYRFLTHKHKKKKNRTKKMLLGKRPQPPLMRRTTSVSGGMSVDMPHDHDNGEHRDDDIIKDPSHHHDHIMGHDMVMVPDHHRSTNSNNIFGSKEDHEYHQEPLLNMVVSPNFQKTQYQLIISNPPSPPHFLRTCGLCKCRLAPGRDIYMYRGDTAFCSLECRDQRIKEDSRKEKRNKMTSNKENHHRASPRATAVTPPRPRLPTKATHN